MAKELIDVRVDEDVYATIEEGAKVVGMDVSDCARQVLAEQGNELRHRFLGAAAHFA